MLQAFRRCRGHAGESISVREMLTRRLCCNELSSYFYFSLNDAKKKYHISVVTLFPPPSTSRFICSPYCFTPVSGNARLDNSPQCFRTIRQYDPGNSLATQANATAGGRFTCQSQDHRPTMSCRRTRSRIRIRRSSRPVVSRREKEKKNISFEVRICRLLISISVRRPMKRRRRQSSPSCNA
ncbi:hypothetical protein PUN28_018807 [Cardiocondyla obscurior]|uniref:Uncharacterized protein n=1 Tax=Cardiocondyla obscurior TaxID=286306 RepID=A0AAW2EI23_9HYME